MDVLFQKESIISVCEFWKRRLNPFNLFSHIWNPVPWRNGRDYIRIECTLEVASEAAVKSSMDEPKI